MSLIRQPIAQSFYPGDCRSQIKNFITGFKELPALPDNLCGAVLPHAGWYYSGGVAARTLFQLSQCCQPETGVIFGTDHYGVERHTLFPMGEWVTPLGKLAVDKEIVRQLIKGQSGLLQCDFRAHEPEHSIEVLTPMIYYFWPEIKLVPIIVKHDPSAVYLGRLVAKIIQGLGKNAVFLASSDLTHYGAVYGMEPAGSGPEAYYWMQKNDQRMIKLLCNMIVERILDETNQHHNACGGGALTALLSALVSIGVDRGFLVEYATSHAEQPREHFHTAVGYAGVVY